MFTFNTCQQQEPIAFYCIHLGFNRPTWLPRGGSSLDPCSTAYTVNCKFLKAPSSQCNMIIALDRGIDHAFSVLVVPRTEPPLLWSKSKLHIIRDDKFLTISVEYVKITSSCETKIVLFGVNFAANLRTFRILPPSLTVVHI